MKIKICGFDKAQDILLDQNPSWTHAISISAPTVGGAIAEDLRDWGAFPGQKLRLLFDDIDHIYPGYQPPNIADIVPVIAMAATLAEDSQILVHWAAGVSRSPAVAFVLLCAALGPGREEEAYAMVKAGAGGIIPNKRIIDIGDHLLGRGRTLSD